MSDTEGERLAKRVAALRGCSRSEAERLIDGGWVRVDGAVVTEPAQRVHITQTVVVDPQAQPLQLVPATLVWHKPAGVPLHDDQPLAGLVEPEGALLPWHVKHLRCVSPMPAEASGLALFVQDPRVQRKVREEGPLLEHEWMLDVASATGTEQVQTLLQTTSMLGPKAWGKLSTSSQNPERTRLRLAAKAYDPRALPAWLSHAGLAVQALHRLRLGRVALGPLAPGAWRLLGPHERV